MRQRIPVNLFPDRGASDVAARCRRVLMAAVSLTPGPAGTFSRFHGPLAAKIFCCGAVLRVYPAVLRGFAGNGLRLRISQS